MNNSIVPTFDEGSSDNLTVRLQRLKGVSGGLMLHLRGDIDSYSANFFMQAGSKAVAAGFANLAVNMRDVPYASSTGIAALANLLKLARQGHGNVVLQSVQPRVAEILSLLGLDSFFSRTGGLAETMDILASCPSYPVSPVFPSVFRCPVCGKRLRARNSGRFLCRECRAVLVVDPSAVVAAV